MSGKELRFLDKASKRQVAANSLEVVVTSFTNAIAAIDWSKATAKDEFTKLNDAMGDAIKKFMEALD